MARLQVKYSEGSAHSIELKLGTNRLGRHLANDFPIDDPAVSGAHCEIVLDDQGVSIRDVGSTNGTFIDGRAIQEARLETGQKIRLGAVELVVESTVVDITIPELEVVPSSSALLADGSRACYNHSQACATRRCTQCHKVFCDACTHELHRIGGKSIRLCPVCSGQCECIRARVAATTKKITFLEQLQKTLKTSLEAETKR